MTACVKTIFYSIIYPARKKAVNTNYLLIRTF